MSIPSWHKQDFMAHVGQDFDFAVAHMVIWWGSNWRKLSTCCLSKEAPDKQKVGVKFPLKYMHWCCAPNGDFNDLKGLKGVHKFMLKSGWKLFKHQPQTRKHFLARLESPWSLQTQIQCCVLFKVMVQKSQRNTWDVKKKAVNHGISTITTHLNWCFARFLNHQLGYFGDGVSISKIFGSWDPPSFSKNSKHQTSGGMRGDVILSFVFFQNISTVWVEIGVPKQTTSLIVS